MWRRTIPILTPHSAANCALEGAKYQETYGISTTGNSVSMKFVTSSGGSKNVGGRIYLLKNETTYEGFKLLNQEFTFDVDMSSEFSESTSHCP